MSLNNSRSRTSNIVRSGVSGAILSAFNIVFGFVYRTVFVYVLSAAYLGVNGLFSNVLAVLSLAELGMTNAITYRFYEPVHHGDVRKVGQLMCFFKRVYLVVAGVILLLGLLLYPWIDALIKDPSEVPADVDLHVVFLLFLIQTASSYLFTYRLTILNADQRQDVYSYIQLVMSFVRYALQIVVLLVWRNYTLTLAVSLVISILLNCFASLWVTSQYRDVFAVREMLPQEERRQVYGDTFATACHLVGEKAITGTDSIVLSAFAGVTIVGLYSNYVLLANGIKAVISKVFSNTTSILGNVHVADDERKGYEVYRHLLALNLFVAGWVACCMALLMDDFIGLWLGEGMRLGEEVAVLLACLSFILLSRQITNSYTNGSGLFVKDRARSLVEAALNLLISLVLVQEMGVIGVLIGTIVSNMLTSFWRMPLILFRHEFKRTVADYWKIYLPFCLFVILFTLVALFIQSMLALQTGWIVWALEAIIITAVYCGAGCLVFFASGEPKYFFSLFLRLLRRGRSVEPAAHESDGD